jgi:hypothetical protein
MSTASLLHSPAFAKLELNLVMLKTVIILAGVCAAPLLMAPSCDRNTCPQDVICTEMFSMVTVQVTRDGLPVTLDRVYTLRSSTGDTIRNEQGMENGMYSVLDDNYRKSLVNQKDNFVFVGIVDGKKAVEEMYVISADCCHINKISGKETIQL